MNRTFEEDHDETVAKTAPRVARSAPPAVDRMLELQRTAGNQAALRALQRVVEVRPPGRGEASAFDRVDELIDRINRQTPGVLYRLDGRRIVYEVLDEDLLQNFDEKMMEFIDNEAVVPMRLITNEGRVGGQRVLIDTVDSAYVDLDDLMASDDLSFQMNLIHLLQERFGIRNYERRIGTNIATDGAGNLTPEFRRAHRAGIDAEVAHLRSFVGDPTIEFVFEEDQGNGRVLFGFRSRTERYRIFHLFRRGGRGVQGGEVFVQTRDNRRITIEELIAEREAAAAAAAPEPVPAAP